MADTSCTTRRTALTALATAAFVTAARSQPAWNTERIQALEAQLRAAPHVRALLMERRGASFAYYQQGISASSRMNVASVTKSVVSLLVGIAMARGAIASVEEPLAAFFPEHAQDPGATAMQRVTLRHLLTMSSGFDRGGLTNDSDYLDFSRRLYAPGILAHALARPLAYEPGSRFQYSNIDSHLLALALARRLKVPLADFAQEVLFRPLGINGAEWPPGQDGVPNGAAELRLTAPEMLRIGQMMRAGGSWEGRQLVPAAFVREATARKIASDIPPRGRPELWGYGYLWWLSSTPGDELPAYNASGFGGQFIYVVPALEVVVVALTEQISRAVAIQTATIIREAALPAAR
jgi:CubicO group peptidase (beta-lactamase class C family)